MMDHRTFIKSLGAEQKATLTAQHPWLGIAHLAGHIAVFTLLWLWIANGWAFWPLAVVPCGIVLVFLFTLEHECTHKTPFPQAWLNETVGHAAGFLLFLPFHWFRYFHLAHHRWTNIEGKDPELHGGVPIGFWPVVWHLSGVPYWLSMFKQIIANAFGGAVGEYVPENAVAKVRREARYLLLAYAVAGLSFFASSILFWIWILPALVGQPFLRLYLMAEHGRCPQVANMFENTRTTYTTAVVRFLAWNMPYHTEHHVYPMVPFHNLPALHDQIKGDLKVTAQGYSSFGREHVAELIRQK